tara:strand:+ start:152 stop:514 length:363 start_codon:yes stop_codon:yes gene_type:complete
MKQSKILSSLLVIFISFLLLNCDKNSVSEYRNDDIINLKGKLSMVGNSPFQSLALNIEGQQVKLILKTKEDFQVYKNKIGKDVKVTGKLKINKLETADRKKKLTEYKLIVDKIKLKQLTL